MSYRLTFALLIALVALAGGCSRGDDPVTVPSITTEPSREDLVQAVRNHVSGKTYEQPVTRTESQTRYCSQFDVDTDPYMPRNPELARCPSVGSTYQVQIVVSDTRTQTCASPPGPEAGWSVVSTGDGRWRVSQGGSAWDVLRRDGAAVSLGEFVRVSGFAFQIVARQDC